MSMQEDIISFINKAVYAPSGENCQPWKFVISGNVVSIYNLEEADTSLYNSHQKGSYIAHGALIENIVISSSCCGYQCDVVLFPEEGNKKYVAKIFFSQGTREEDVLSQYITQRVTNRKTYSGAPVTHTHKKQLERSYKDFSFANDIAIVFVDDSTLCNIIGKSLAVHEEILFEHKDMHHFFYSHLLFDKKDESTSGGFYVDTLEFLPHEKMAVRLFKSWNILSFFNKWIHVSKKIASDNAKKYARSGTLAAFRLKNHSEKDFVNFGRVLQRVWLTATQENLAFHPCNGTLYLNVHLEDHGGRYFNQHQQHIIREAYSALSKAFSSNTNTNDIVFIFRIGTADNPTAKARRLPPSIDIL